MSLVKGSRFSAQITEGSTHPEFEAYLKKAGIQHEKTIPRNPEQNGVAEHMNRTQYDPY